MLLAPLERERRNDLQDLVQPILCDYRTAMGLVFSGRHARNTGDIEDDMEAARTSPEKLETLSGKDRAMGRQLLIAEADCRLSARLEKYFAAHEYSVRLVSGGVECLTALHETSPDVLLLDTELNWGGADGVLTVMDEEDGFSKIPVVLLTDTYASSGFSEELVSLKLGDEFKIPSSPDLPNKLYHSAHVVDRVPRRCHFSKLLDSICQASAPPTQPR